MEASKPAPAEGAGPGTRAGLPRAFGRYTLFDHIGRGGMADIYLAYRRDGLGGRRHVVIKEVLPELSADDAFAKMLIAEAKLAARLSHANVVQVMDLGREAERLFIAMEYVEGFDLHQLLRRLSKARVPLPAEFALFIVRETLRALDYAHRARDDEGRPLGLVHRDVSPSNVLVSFEGEIKLCDFGIARAFSRDEGAPDDEAISKGRIAGKSAYMAPEHAAGEEIDARADVFAAGILLWELSAGRRLYRGSEQEMLDMARSGDVPRVPEGRLPDQERLQAVLDRALARDTIDRYPTAAAFLADLEDYAISVRLMASPLRFGAFLTDNFAEEVLAGRRDRERQAAYHDERDATGSSVRSIVERAGEPVSAETETATDSETETATETATDSETETETATDSETETETDSETETATATETDSQPAPAVHSADTAPTKSIPPEPPSRLPMVAIGVVLVVVVVGAAIALL